MNHKWIMNPWLWMALDGMVMLHVSNVFSETKLWELEYHYFLWWQLSKETCMWMVRHIQMQYLYPCHPSGYTTCSWTNLFEIVGQSRTWSIWAIWIAIWGALFEIWLGLPGTAGSQARTWNDRHKQRSSGLAKRLLIDSSSCKQNNNAWCTKSLPRQQEVIRGP